MTLEGASAQSGVPLRYVRMFEDGRYPMVSDPVYLTHFVRRYAACLGLDELLTANEFVEEIVHSKREPLPAILAQTSRDCATSIRSRKPRSPGRSLSFYAGPLSVVAVAWAVGPLSPLNQRIEPPPALSVLEGHREPSAVLLAMLTEPSEEFVPASMSPFASQTPATEPPSAPIEVPLPAIVDLPVAEASTDDLPAGDVVPKKPDPAIADQRSATNKASDDLRAEQLERLKRKLTPDQPAGAADGA